MYKLIVFCVINFSAFEPQNLYLYLLNRNFINLIENINGRYITVFIRIEYFLCPNREKLQVYYVETYILECSFSNYRPVSFNII